MLQDTEELEKSSEEIPPDPDFDAFSLGSVKGSDHTHINIRHLRDRIALCYVVFAIALLTAGIGLILLMGAVALPLYLQRHRLLLNLGEVFFGIFIGSILMLRGSTSWRCLPSAWWRVIKRNLRSIAIVLAIPLFISGCIQAFLLARVYSAVVREAQKTLLIIAIEKGKVARLEGEKLLLELEIEALQTTLKSSLSRGGKGTYLPAPASRSGYRDRGVLLGTFLCTGYNNVPEQCDSSPDITASGRRIALGYSIALDPAFWGGSIALAKGVELWVEGVGVCRWDDTGSLIKGQWRMDIACATEAQALILSGKRRVWLLEGGAEHVDSR